MTTFKANIITTSKVEANILSGSIIYGIAEGTRPEDFGAKGDGVDCDWLAFQDMFTYLKTSSGKHKKVILRPENYYSIQSAIDATNVFEIDIENLIMEGPGMNKKTLHYEGDDTVTNFFSFSQLSYFTRLSEMKVYGDASKITNIIRLNDTNYCSFDRLILRYGTGAGITGFNWMTEARHCVFQNMDVGLDSIATTTHVIGCYANACGSKGFNIFTRYGTYMSCACDSTPIAYYLAVPWSVALIGCGCEQCDQAIVGEAVQLSVQGFGVDQTGMSGLPDACIELTNTKGRITGFQGKVLNAYKIKGTNCPYLQIESERTDGGYGFSKREIYMEDATEVAQEKFPHMTGRQVAGYPFISKSASEFEDVCKYDYTSYDGCQAIEVLFSSATPTISSFLTLQKLTGRGYLKFRSTSALGADLTFTGIDGGQFAAFHIRESRIPIIFESVKFTFTYATANKYLFYIKDCDVIKFKACEFEADDAAQRVFNFDSETEFTIEIDKATMDVMSGFTQLAYGSGDDARHRFKFVNYTDKPAAGTFDTGMRIYFTAPAAGGSLGCVCTTGGTPGTWKYFGAVEA